MEDADAEEVCRLLAEGKRVADPELMGGIRRRAEAVREQIRPEHVVDGAVDLIRAARPGSPTRQPSGWTR